MTWRKNFSPYIPLICGMIPSQMTITQISSRLVELLRNKAFIQALKELYDENAISLEPGFHPYPKTQGLPALLKKEQLFLDSIHSWHDLQISEALISKSHFSIRMFSNLQLKSETKLEIDEIIVYQVKNGKIIQEMYFYELP